MTRERSGLNIILTLKLMVKRGYVQPLNQRRATCLFVNPLHKLAAAASSTTSYRAPHEVFTCEFFIYYEFIDWLLANHGPDYVKYTLFAFVAKWGNEERQIAAEILEQFDQEEVERKMESCLKEFFQECILLDEDLKFDEHTRKAIEADFVKPAKYRTSDPALVKWVEKQERMKKNNNLVRKIVEHLKLLRNQFNYVFDLLYKPLVTIAHDIDNDLMFLKQTDDSVDKKILSCVKRQQARTDSAATASSSLQSIPSTTSCDEPRKRQRLLEQQQPLQQLHQQPQQQPQQQQPQQQQPQVDELKRQIAMQSKRIDEIYAYAKTLDSVLSAKIGELASKQEELLQQQQQQQQQLSNDRNNRSSTLDPYPPFSPIDTNPKSVFPGGVIMGAE